MTFYKNFVNKKTLLTKL